MSHIEKNQRILKRRAKKMEDKLTSIESKVEPSHGEDMDFRQWDYGTYEEKEKANSEKDKANAEQEAGKENDNIENTEQEAERKNDEEGEEKEADDNAQQEDEKEKENSEADEQGKEDKGEESETEEEEVGGKQDEEEGEEKEAETSDEEKENSEDDEKVEEKVVEFEAEGEDDQAEVERKEDQEEEVEGKESETRSKIRRKVRLMRWNLRLGRRDRKGTPTPPRESTEELPHHHAVGLRQWLQETSDKDYGGRTRKAPKSLIMHRCKENAAVAVPKKSGRPKRKSQGLEN
ncbi:hypothetical protein Bca52824_078376 [Brassica carinata]|uniref:Uncharacterized protein n=1 Tax=Brassica carinata TaxID=52824 RepID=A0A8X7TYF5_BRACI|nr:hypothetical protein Bca52824_078376 [Brassica carinata]